MWGEMVDQNSFRRLKENVDLNAQSSREEVLNSETNNKKHWSLPGGIMARAKALLSSISAAFGFTSFRPWKGDQKRNFTLEKQTNFKKGITYELDLTRRSVSSIDIKGRASTSSFGWDSSGVSTIGFSSSTCFSLSGGSSGSSSFWDCWSDSDSRYSCCLNYTNITNMMTHDANKSSRKIHKKDNPLNFSCFFYASYVEFLLKKKRNKWENIEVKYIKLYTLTWDKYQNTYKI